MEAESRRATVTSIRRRSPVKGSNRPRLYPFAVDYNSAPPLRDAREVIYRTPDKKHLVRITHGKTQRSPPHSGEAPSDNGWPASRLAGRVGDGATSNLRSYWQQNVARDERMRQEAALRARPAPYGFPRWRSSDALSASLVASNPVEIPRDSRIPEQRIAKMKDTEREAVVVRQQIQQEATLVKKLSKGKSLDSLIFIPDQPTWYSREKIREAVSRESIANINAARQRFESGSSIPPPPPPPPERSSSANAVPPPLPPKSEEVQMLQRTMHKEDSYDREYNSPSINSFSTNQYSQVEWGGINGYQPREPSFSYEQQLLLLYLRQNPQLIESLGIKLPEDVRHGMDEIAWRRVELRVAEEEQNSYTPQSYSPSQGKGGRYVKKPQQQGGAPARYKKGPGESLIAAEIRAAKEREEELRRSRSELGLPTLEDTMDMWRNGQRINISINGMRSAVSYDQLHDQNSIGDLQKTASIGELTRENYYERDDRNQRTPATNYKLQNTEDQDVMYYGPPSRRLGQARFQ